MTESTTTPNLRTTRKETAKKGVAATKKAPANPAGVAALAAAPKVATPKLRWVAEGERSHKAKESTAISGDRAYAIKRDGDKWVATVTVDDVVTTLSNTSFGRAYQSCVDHNREHYAQAAAA